jgi:hypothetical protein
MAEAKPQNSLLIKLLDKLTHEDTDFVDFFLVISFILANIHTSSIYLNCKILMENPLAASPGQKNTLSIALTNFYILANIYNLSKALTNFYILANISNLSKALTNFYMLANMYNLSKALTNFYMLANI